MKLQLVKTDKGYVAISDEDIKEGDCIWYKNTKMIGFAGEDNIDKFYYAKIIATDTSFKLEGIPQFELEKDDINILLLANKWAIDNPDDTMATNSALNRGFIAGYKAACRQKDY